MFILSEKSCPNYSSLQHTFIFTLPLQPLPDVFGINTFKVQLLSRPADVLMEFLLQLDEAVISLLCEGDVSQHCCHSVWSHCCRLHTAQTFIVNQVILVFN